MLRLIQVLTSQDSSQKEFKRNVIRNRPHESETKSILKRRGSGSSVDPLFIPLRTSACLARVRSVDNPQFSSTPHLGQPVDNLPAPVATGFGKCPILDRQPLWPRDPISKPPISLPGASIPVTGYPHQSSYNNQCKLMCIINLSDLHRFYPQSAQEHY